MEEALDDLCLLLGYGIRSLHSAILYTTYTAWWEVEGFVGLDGEFVCRDGTALQHRLITMPIKQFVLVAELAYQVCVLDAEAEEQPRPPTGQEWLQALATWLGAGAPEPFHSQIWRSASHTTPLIPQQQLSRKQRRTLRRRLAQELAEQAWQRGYLLLGPDVGPQVPILIQSRCTKHRRPYISVEPRGERFADISIELRPVRKAFEAEGKLLRGTPLPAIAPTNEIRQRLASFAAHYSARAETGPQEEAFRFALQGEVFELKQVLQADVPRAVEDFMALWPDILAHYEVQLEANLVADLERQRQAEEALARYKAQLEANLVADLERQRQAEEVRTAWVKTLARLSAQGQTATCPELNERVVLPVERVARLSKEQLGAFLAFLKVPASSREMKANLVQQLLTSLLSNWLCRPGNSRHFLAAQRPSASAGRKSRSFPSSAMTVFARLAATMPMPSTIGG
jgi:hypothetical protein